MNKRRLITCGLYGLFGGILSPLHAITEQNYSINLQGAIVQALDKNFQIQVDRFEPLIAEQRLREAKGQFDPAFTSTYTYSNRELDGFNFDQESANATVGLVGRLPWGTEYFAGIDISDTTTPFDPITLSFSDSISSFSGVSITQPLLRNFGWDGAYSEVRIAREGRRFSEEELRLTAMQVVTEVISAYHDVFFAQENLRISVRNRDLAKKLLSDNKKRVETGAMAPLDIVQAESEAALREVSVISADAFLKRQQNRLKALLFSHRDDINEIQLMLESPEVPEKVIPQLTQDVLLALKSRPDYLQADLSLSITEWQLRQSRRNALPQVDIIASYGRLGMDNDLNDSLRQSMNDGREAYTIGAVVNIPFPNRQRSAEQAIAYLRRNQTQVLKQQLEQEIRLQVDDAITQVRADWNRIQAAKESRRLAQKALKAEEKKLQAGTSSTFVVLRLQGDLAAAEIREIIAVTDYAKSLGNYDFTRGLTLEVHEISLAE